MTSTRPLVACATFALLACNVTPDGSSDDGVLCGPGFVPIDGGCSPVDSSSGDASSDGADTFATTAATSGDDDDASGDTSASSDPSTSDAGSEEGSTGSTPVAIDLHDVIFHDNPPNVADWPITTAITHLEFREGGLYVEFSKKDGPERWPDIVPPGWDGPLQYTLGFVEFIDGQWHASAAMQYWYGLDVQGGNVAVDNQVAINWYYDARWGEMAGYQPALGETIGVFIVAGNLRGVLDGSQSPVQERSDVVVVPMPGPEGAVHDF